MVAALSSSRLKQCSSAESHGEHSPLFSSGVSTKKINGKGRSHRENWTGVNEVWELVEEFPKQLAGLRRRKTSLGPGNSGVSASMAASWEAARSQDFGCMREGDPRVGLAIPCGAKVTEAVYIWAVSYVEQTWVLEDRLSPQPLLFQTPSPADWHDTGLHISGLSESSK